jgi:nitrate reductase gamma subunit
MAHSVPIYPNNTPNNRWQNYTHWRYEQGRQTNYERLQRCYEDSRNNYKKYSKSSYSWDSKAWTFQDPCFRVLIWIMSQAFAVGILTPLTAFTCSSTVFPRVMVSVLGPFGIASGIYCYCYNSNPPKPTQLKLPDLGM